MVRPTANTLTLHSVTPGSTTFSLVSDLAFLPTAFDMPTDASVSCIQLYNAIRPELFLRDLKSDLSAHMENSENENKEIN